VKKELTVAWLRKKDACEEAIEMFKAQKERDSIKLVKKCLKQDHFDWANWLVTNLMTKKQCVQYSIFAAELVLHNFEKNQPNDDRPRKAIEAAKAYLKNPCDRTKNDARSAWSAWSAESAIIKYGVKLLMEQSDK